MLDLINTFDQFFGPINANEQVPDPNPLQRFAGNIATIHALNTAQNMCSGMGSYDDSDYLRGVDTLLACYVDNARQLGELAPEEMSVEEFTLCTRGVWELSRTNLKPKSQNPTVLTLKTIMMTNQYRY